MTYLSVLVENSLSESDEELSKGESEFRNCGFEPTLVFVALLFVKEQVDQRMVITYFCATF